MQKTSVKRKKQYIFETKEILTKRILNQTLADFLHKKKHQEIPDLLRKNKHN